MTHSQACRPCAKRKVRCDRKKPCSNCRRRTTDRCIYPSSTPPDRVRQLEGLVRELGGNPDGDRAYGTPSSIQSPAVAARPVAQRDGEVTPAEMRSNDPVVLVEDGQMQYLESYRAWQGWRGRPETELPANSKRFHTSRARPHAMSSTVISQSSMSLSIQPVSLQQAEVLWHTFRQRVEPLIRIIYRWALDEFRSSSTHPELQKTLTRTQDALLSAIYYVSAHSLTDDESLTLLQQPRASFVAECHARCENALLGTNLFCMSDLNVIKATIYYVMASFERLSTQSLWSLMGIVLRSAEKLGLHRDGSLLGLPPVEIEDRRRVWWQLQHIDLALAIKIGLTPMTLTAGWDVQIPSNIEDHDISTSSTTIPKERKGLTSMSYCLFTYWVLNAQRQTFIAKHGRFELSWQTNTALPKGAKDDMLSQLEEGINQNFVQYCDPLKPLDVLLQLFARFFVVAMSLRVLYNKAVEDSNGEERLGLLDASMQTLRYYIAIQNQPSLAQFRWLTKAWFAWQAFMFVLIEASNQVDIHKARELWDLLASVYAANTDLLELEEDRRKLHAAELVIAAWNAHRSKSDNQQLENPTFIVELRQKLATYRADFEPGAAQAGQQQGHDSTEIPAGFGMDGNFDFDFEMDLQDMDWSFWSSMD